MGKKEEEGARPGVNKREKEEEGENSLAWEGSLFTFCRAENPLPPPLLATAASSSLFLSFYPLPFYGVVGVPVPRCWVWGKERELSGRFILREYSKFVKWVDCVFLPPPSLRRGICVSGAKREAFSRSGLLPPLLVREGGNVPIIRCQQVGGGSVRGMGRENQNVRVKCIGWEEEEA